MRWKLINCTVCLTVGVIYAIAKIFLQFSVLLTRYFSDKKISINTNLEKFLAPGYVEI